MFCVPLFASLKDDSDTQTPFFNSLLQLQPLLFVPIVYYCMHVKALGLAESI